MSKRMQRPDFFSTLPHLTYITPQYSPYIAKVKLTASMLLFDMSKLIPAPGFSCTLSSSHIYFTTIQPLHCKVKPGCLHKDIHHPAMWPVQLMQSRKWVILSLLSTVKQNQMQKCKESALVYTHTYAQAHTLSS